MRGKANLYEKILFTISFLTISYGYIKIFYYSAWGSNYLYWGMLFSFLTILLRLIRHYLKEVRPRMLKKEERQALIARQKELEEWDDTVQGIKYLVNSQINRLKEWGISLTGKAVNLLDDWLETENTYNLKTKYSKWHNNYLLKKTLDYESTSRHYFKVTVLESDTLHNLLFVLVKYENMTAKNIRSFIPNCLAREIMVDRKSIHIHDAGDNLVKVIIEIS